MEKDKILALLAAADWEDISLRLTYYSVWRANRYSWRSGHTDQLLAGKTPEDISCEAIKKVISGTRDWDPDKYPDLFTHLKWIVDSDMEHLYSSLEHRKTGPMPRPRPSDNSSVDCSEIPSDPSSPIHPYIPTPEEALSASEEKELEEKFKNKLYELVKEDEDLELLWLYLVEGIFKPRDIAAETGWDISKVYNLKRKFSRLASSIDRLSLMGD